MSIDFNVDAALARLGELAAKHGPDAIDLAARVVQINAVGDLTRGVAAAAVAIVGGVLSARLARRALADWATYGARNREWLNDHSGRVSMPDTPVFATVVGAFGVLASLLFAINAFVGLSNPWLWVALTNPKLALARDIFNKIVAVAS